jgi:hypothetical protein
MSVFGSFPLDRKNTVVYVEIPLFVVASNVPSHNHETERGFQLGVHNRAKSQLLRFEFAESL